MGDTVVVRTGGTPESFTLSDRARPFQDPIGLYLVPNEIDWKVDEEDVQPRYRRLVVLNVVPSGSSSSTGLIAGGLAALALAFAAGTVVLRRRNTTSSTVSQ